MSQTILLVDDEENDVFFMMEAFKRMGISKCQVVHDGQQAVDYLSGTGRFADRAQFPQPTLVLLDLKLPHVMGLEVLRRIRERPGGPIVIILSASSDATDISTAYSIGANAYLVKPSSVDELYQLVKSIKDFGPDDRIAVPTIRASMQAMMMGIALEQAYGIGQHGRLDSNQVQLGHPDALQALLSPQHEVNSHFSIPPFQDIAMKSPLVHHVLTSTDVLGGPASITNAWSTQRFVEGNPIKIKAFIAALDEASDMVVNDTRAAAEIYLGVTKEKITVDELVAVIKQPGAIFSATPQRSMLWAEYMHRIGLIKQKPASWKDYSFPNIHDRNGS